MDKSRTMHQNSEFGAKPSQTMSDTKRNFGGTTTLKKGMDTSSSKLNAGKPKKQVKSIEEEIMEKEISTVERTRLNKVFKIFCGGRFDTTGDMSMPRDREREREKEANEEQTERIYFTAKDVERILKQLDYPLQKHEIDQMVWEVDENLDGRIDA